MSSAEPELSLSPGGGASPMIILLDMDCFFCQVHCRHDPTLLGAPVAAPTHLSNP